MFYRSKLGIHMKSFLALFFLIFLSVTAFAQDVAKAKDIPPKTASPAEVVLNPMVVLKLENAAQKARIEQLELELYGLKAQSEWKELKEKLTKSQDASNA